MLDKLALGTVQFGLDYGVKNYSGRVLLNEAYSILEFAKGIGIDTLDTASGYGKSESVLGEIGVSDYRIITKTVSIDKGINKVLEGFYNSLESLRVECLEGLLVHHFTDVKKKEFNLLFNNLTRLKQDGLIEKIGFSVYTPDQVDFLLSNFDFDLIQLPFNVFDNRLVLGGQLNALRNRSIEIHARSIFLQGILVDFENLPAYFSNWHGRFRLYKSFVQEYSMSLLEYALNFALNTQEIDKVLVGVNNQQQLREIVKAAKRMEGLKSFPINDEDLLNPSRWKT